MNKRRIWTEMNGNYFKNFTTPFAYFCIFITTEYFDIIVSIRTVYDNFFKIFAVTASQKSGICESN